MIRYVLKRVLWLIPVIIAVSFIVFSLMELAPGNMMDAIRSEDLTPDMRAEMISRYNLDRPMIYRYGLYMMRLVQGDLGVSDLTGISVWSTFINRLPNTLILSFSALIIGAVVAIPLGIIAARKAGTLVDTSVTIFSLIGMSMPQFWVGLLLLLFFSLNLGWLPSGTNEDGIRSLILPALCSSFIMMASTARQTRSNMLEVLKSDCLNTARAKGVPEEVVIRKHALGNAWIPIITALGTGLSVQLAGAVVVEQVFSWPGIGRLAAEAVLARDVTTATGVVIMTTILYVLVQLIVDLLYAFVDPRIKSQYMSGRMKKKRSSIEAIKRDADPPQEAVSAKPAVSQEPQTSAIALPIDGLPDGLDDNNLSNKPAHTSSSQKQEQIAAPVQKKSAVTLDAAKPVLTDSEVSLLVKQYRKRSRMGEIFYNINKNKGAVAGFIILGVICLAFIVSLFISFESITAMNAQQRFAAPSWQLPFGADDFGRNVFLRVIYGTRYTLAIGFGAVALATVFGVTLGCFAGYYGGIVEDIIMRVSDVLSSIPGMLLGMVIMTVLGQSLRNLIVAVGVQSIPIYLRMTRASILTVRNNEFVEASRAIGFSNIRIIFTQVLPNGLSPIIVTITASLGISIIVAASLSYLSFGVPVPHPEWGALISTTKEFARRAPFLLTFPGLSIMITVLAFNLIGDGLRDALDPKLKR